MPEALWERGYWGRAPSAGQCNTLSVYFLFLGQMDSVCNTLTFTLAETTLANYYCTEKTPFNWDIL